jgi:peptidyl-prolyl cis-trans isomerase SurA
MKPFLVQLGNLNPAERAAARSKLHTEMLERMVDEELLQRAASQSGISVTRDEVEAAIEGVAKDNQVTKDVLLAEVVRSGVSASHYRAEIRRQLLDAKVMSLRLQGIVRVSSSELDKEYEELKVAELAHRLTTLAAIRIGYAPDASDTEIERQRDIAHRLATQARQGADLEALSRQYSTDRATRETGGRLPPVAPNQMPQELAEAVVALPLGGVSDPVQSGDTWVVIKVLERVDSELPELDALKPQLEQRARVRKMEKARANWLESLRKSTHVEIRI